MRLNCTYHPIKLLHDKAGYMVPGIESVDAIFRDFDNNLKAIFVNETVVLTGEELLKFQKKRTAINRPSWFDRNNFYTSFSTARQLDLDDEDKYTSLVLPFKSQLDGNNDILIIHFQNRIGLISFDKAFKNLTTDEKTLISTILFNALQKDHENAMQDHHAFEQIKSHYNKIQEDQALLKTKLATTEQIFHKAMVRLIHVIVAELEIKNRCKIRIDDNALRKLVIHQLDFEQLKSALIDAFFIAFNLSLGLNEITINENHIEISVNEEAKSQDSPQLVGDKIVTLLDRYELAAQIIYNKGLAVNGKNVAAHLNPPVTPPAITDALRKNERKIISLLEAFPSKWKLIRKSLKPLKEQHEKLAFRYKSSA
jgi:hypothetical protein